MQIVQLSKRTKQALLIILLIIAIITTFFATRAWAMQPKSSTAPPIKTSVYEEFLEAKPIYKATTTTSTTTTTLILPPKPITTIPAANTAPAITQASGDVWEALRNCESHGNYSINTGNGYYGAYQFSYSTWKSMGTEYEYAHLAPPEIQDDAAKRLQARSGWGQWPVCSKIALRVAGL